MPKFYYTFGGDSADWEEHLYHRSFAVTNGQIEFEDDDALATDALLRRGWELVDEQADAAPSSAPAKTSRARASLT